MNPDVLIGMHAYRKANNGKEEKTVLVDRIEKTYEVAQRLHDLGLSVGVVFLGGYDVDGNTTAEISRDIALDLDSVNLADFSVFIADEYGGNTRAEVDSFIDLADEVEPEVIISVSSRDHAPRIMRIWNQKPLDIDANVSVVSSDETYSKSELAPFILEGAGHEPFVDVLDEIFSVDEENYEDAAEEIKSVLKKY